MDWNAMARQYSVSTMEIHGDWTIETTVYKTCLPCLIEGGEEADMGTTIDHTNKSIQLSHYVVVDAADCDYESEHLDKLVDHGLQEALAQGLIEQVVEDGEIKYRAI